MKIQDEKILQIDCDFEKDLIAEIENKTKILIDSNSSLFENFIIYLQQLDNEMDFYYDEKTKSHVAYFCNRNKLYLVVIPVDVSSGGHFIKINGVIHIYLKDENFDYNQYVSTLWNCEIRLTHKERNELEEYLKSKNIRYYFN